MPISTVTINVTAQKATIAVLLAALVEGIRTELAGVDPIVLDGTSFARTDLLARIQATLDAIASVKSARTALLQAVTSQKAAVAQAKALRAGMKRYLQTKYGPNSPKLQKFGFTQTRTPKTLVRTKAEAKVRAAATRKARGTKGRKQRLAITGASAPVAPPAPVQPASGTPTKS
jgi:septal ring factor EnvC (AmiA/AmiB activator)